MAVTNTPDVLTEATAELALALTLAAARRMSDAERDLRAGQLARLGPGGLSRSSRSRARQSESSGLGRIGHRYAQLAHGLGAKIVYAGPTAKPEAESELGARRLDLDDLLAASDVVSLHAPSTPETHAT